MIHATIDQNSFFVLQQYSYANNIVVDESMIHLSHRKSEIIRHD